jgi:hypothetical protein
MLIFKGILLKGILLSQQCPMEPAELEFGAGTADESPT